MERKRESETECAHCNAVLVAAADDNYDDDDNDDFSSCCQAYERDLVEAIQAQEGSSSLLLLQFHVLVHEIVSVYYYLPSFDTTQIAMVCYGMV